MSKPLIDGITETGIYINQLHTKKLWSLIFHLLLVIRPNDMSSSITFPTYRYLSPTRIPYIDMDNRKNTMENPCIYLTEYEVFLARIGRQHKNVKM